jgi:hypothetical protein
MHKIKLLIVVILVLASFFLAVISFVAPSPAIADGGGGAEPLGCTRCWRVGYGVACWGWGHLATRCDHYRCEDYCTGEQWEYWDCYTVYDPWCP